MHLRYRDQLKAQSKWLREQAEYTNSIEKRKSLLSCAGRLKRALNVSTPTRKKLIDCVYRELHTWRISLRGDGQGFVVAGLRTRELLRKTDEMENTTILDGR